ncbi:MAG TPA: hypothetical protein VG271_11250 [Beijerinckiaceae bacterium]|nr:hypothetical protein [Beijerinckiaceae bacterium]
MKTLAFDDMRRMLRRNRKNEMFKMVATLGVVTLLGIGIAATAISAAPAQTENISMRPLSTARGLIVSPAFGDNDEDCTIVTKPRMLANGHMHLDRETLCIH